MLDDLMKSSLLVKFDLLPYIEFEPKKQKFKPF